MKTNTGQTRLYSSSELLFPAPALDNRRIAGFCRSAAFILCYGPALADCKAMAILVLRLWLLRGRFVGLWMLRRECGSGCEFMMVMEWVCGCCDVGFGYCEPLMSY